MSVFNNIKILDCDSVENFISGWNEAEENKILLLLTSNSSATSKKVDMDRILEMLKDPKIGFVYTDVITINNENISNIEYLNGIDLPNIPFFAKKINSLKFKNISNENLMIDIMKNYIDNKYYFHHIADPIIKMNI